MVTDPAGPETKNDCAGERPQQITRPDQTRKADGSQWLAVNYQPVRTEAAKRISTVRSCYQATSCEEIVIIHSCSYSMTMQISDSVIINCSYK
jgi:hypothetical protein